MPWVDVASDELEYMESFGVARIERTQPTAAERTMAVEVIIEEVKNEAGKKIVLPLGSVTREPLGPFKHNLTQFKLPPNLTSSTHHTSRPKQSSHHRPNELKHLRWLHAHCANGIDGTIIDLIKEFDISTAIISSARKSMIVNE